MVKTISCHLLESKRASILCPVSADGKFNLKINKYLAKGFPTIKKNYKMLIKSGRLRMGGLVKVTIRNIDGIIYDIVFIAIRKEVDSNTRPTYVKHALRNFMILYKDLIVTSMVIPLYGFEMKMPINEQLKLFKESLNNTIIEIDIQTEELPPNPKKNKRKRK